MAPAHEPAGYRERIYANYVQGREAPLAPTAVAGLAPRLHLLKKIISQHFGTDRNITIVDLGCGYGAFVHACRLAGFENVTGVDGSAEQIEAGTRLGIPGLAEGDLIAHLRTLRDAAVDIVIAFDVIEHFTKGELVGFVDEVHRVLKPGGKWIIHAPNGDSPWAQRMVYGDYTHEQAFTCSSLHQLLKSSQFRSVNCFEDTPVPHGPVSLIRYFLWGLLRNIYRLQLAIETGSLNRNIVLSQNLTAVAVK